MGDQRRRKVVLDDAYLPLQELASYSGLSVPTLREWLTHPEHPLPHLRVGKMILVKRSEYDGWVQQFRVKAELADADQETREWIRGLVKE